MYKAVEAQAAKLQIEFKRFFRHGMIYGLVVGLIWVASSATQ